MGSAAGLRSLNAKVLCVGTEVLEAMAELCIPTMM